jgi:hypothetical protein
MLEIYSNPVAIEPLMPTAKRGPWAEYVSTFLRGLKALGDEVVVVKPRGRGYLLERC